MRDHSVVQEPVKDWVGAAEEAINKVSVGGTVELKRLLENQYVGPCPGIGSRNPSSKVNKAGHTKHYDACPGKVTGDDRFVCFEEGNYWCRTCGVTGWWGNPDPQAIQRIKEERAENQVTLREQMATYRKAWVEYNTHPNTEPSWLDHAGYTEEIINRWGLGYCESCPTMTHKPSLTIPVFIENQLVDIRHRIIGGDSNGFKYSSHIKGMIASWYNLDSIMNDRIVVVVEGEKKAIAAAEAGFASVLAYPGVESAQYLRGVIEKYGGTNQEWVLVPDPGTEKKILATAREASAEGHKIGYVDPIMKPDDFIMEFGRQAFANMIDNRRWL